MIKVMPEAGAGICVVDPRLERLTAANATAFRDELIALLDRGEDRLLIDMGGVEFVDSSGVGAMVGVLKRIGNRGEIAVCALTGNVEKMFRITRMDRVFAIYRDRAAGIAAMNEGA